VRVGHTARVRTAVLLAATPESATSTPVIFDGLLEPGAQAAQALLVLGKVARSRFFTPPSMLARIIAESDPVISADGATLRAESFSLCCGVHARFDVLPGDAMIGTGCTNVDLSVPTRDLLAGVAGIEPLALTVRGDGIRLRTLDGDQDESRARLPPRWVRGFAEVAAVTAAMTARAHLDSAALRSFLRSIPARVDGSPAWVVRSGTGLRLTRYATPDAVPAGGLHRLRIVEPLLRFAKSMTLFGPADGATGEASVWVLELTGARFTVTLSPTPARGFSGEGGWLSALADDLVAADIAGGRVGFDLGAGEWFDRPLPVPETDVEARNPRFAKARMLAGSGAVHVTGTGFEVRHGESIQRVRLDPDGCTCPWWAKHGGRRGPCSHVLAARLSAKP
jgi:hypothetical protein